MTRIFRWGMVVAMAVPLFLFGSPQAHAAACNLSDARTIDSFTYNGGASLVELRYSPRCYSAWARITNGYGCNAWICNTGWTEAARGPKLSFYAGPGPWYSEPVSFQYYVRACVQIGSLDAPWQQYLCTRWH